MIEIMGKYNTAKCFTDLLESSAYGQILAVCNEEVFADSRIRIMPDVHAGKGCTIGTTMTITDKVVPGMVGVDIGCGMETVKIKEKDIDFEKLDALIRKEIPCGRVVRQTPHNLAREIKLKDLRCADAIDLAYARRSIGTLGGGNHFIELDKDAEGNVYLVVHSGSRHLGCEVARIYQQEGYRAMRGDAHYQVMQVVETMKAQGREKEIESVVKEMRKKHRIDIPRDLAYVEGRLFEDYIHDMKIVQRFATLNRKAMVDVILEGMNFTEVDRFTTIHNYIDTDSMILRKGAVSAKKGEKLLIPINMRDGSLICIGKGNEDWNCSAPHGAGRLMSRGAASETLSLEEYKEQMRGIFTTCVSADTLDESPMAYKSMENLVNNITPTADIVCRITPIYNFKAAE
ncbi:MAG: RtcB family protein [Ruminococcaceae bacterium]|nr:RtcB family protein [Oscillospiraceae bacterium]